jgi:hypothetical protein
VHENPVPLPRWSQRILSLGPGYESVASAPHNLSPGLIHFSNMPRWIKICFSCVFRELGYNFYPTGLLDGTVHGDTVEVKLPFSKFNAPGDVRATFFLYCISLFDYLQFMEGHTRWLSSCIVFPSSTISNSWKGTFGGQYQYSVILRVSQCNLIYASFQHWLGNSTPPGSSV